MSTQPLHHKTPCLYSNKLSQLLNKEVWLKMENTHASGSYKIRGIGRLCQYYQQQGAHHLIASSAGNAGFTVAYVAKQLNLQSTIFVPENSLAIYTDAMKALGANVVNIGDSWDDANLAALKFCKTQQGAFIPPFDHPLIWSGHASIIDEVFADDINPDAIVTAVGGGGLASGLCEGLHHYGRDDITLIAAEPLGAAKFAKSLEAKRLVALDHLDTIAKTLATKQCCAKILEWSMKRPILSTLISDQEALEACSHFANDHRAIVEPATGVALAVLYQQKDILKNFNRILVVVCGGIGVSLSLLAKWQ